MRETRLSHAVVPLCRFRRQVTQPHVAPHSFGVAFGGRTHAAATGHLNHQPFTGRHDLQPLRLQFHPGLQRNRTTFTRAAAVAATGGKFHPFETGEQAERRILP